MKEVLTILSSLIFLAVICFYMKQLVQGQSTPNPATWVIWLLVSALNLFTYFAVVDGDMFKSLLSITMTSGIAFVFLYAFVKGKIGKAGKVEVFSFLLAVGVGILWQTTGNADISNLLLQGVFLISFVPTVIGLLKNELREKSLPWDLAVIAYVLQTAAIIVDWSNSSWVELGFPIVNGLLGNGSVALTIRIVKRRV